jgi:TatD DNase family protein
MLIDTHCHLNSSRFKKDLPEVVARAVDAGVTQMIAIGCDVPSSRRAIEIAEQFPQVLCTVGVHPCYVMDVTEPDWLEQIAAMAEHPRVVAIGEIGLDYYHEPQGTTWEIYKARQASFFKAQMELAVARKLNIVVHQRSCFEDSVALVAPFTGKLRAQFHCFINTWADAAPLVAQGHVISFTGIATYPKAPEVLQCASEAAAGCFMVETDAPYLTPQAVKGQRCEPAHVRHTAEKIAQARGVSLESLAAETTALAREFFRLEKFD